MVLFNGCQCCVADSCLGLGYPDFFEFDLAFEYDGGGGCEVRETLLHTSAEVGIINESTYVTTAIPARAPSAVSVRANKFFEGLISNTNTALYSYLGENFDVSVTVNRYFPSAASLQYPGSIGANVIVSVSAGTYTISGTVTGKSLSGYDPATGYIYTNISSTCPYDGIPFRLVTFLNANIYCGSTATAINPIGGEKVVSRSANIDSMSPAAAYTGYGNQYCLIGSALLNKTYASCSNQVALDASASVTDGTFFPMKRTSTRYLYTNTFDNDYINYRQERIQSKKEIVSAGSGTFSTPPGMESYSSLTYFGKCKATTSILAARYGYGTSVGVDLVPSGLSKSNIGTNGYDCVSGTKSLWLFDYE